MDALETLVRDTLVDHASDAPADDTLLGVVLQPRRRRPWPAIGLGAAVIVAVAIAVAVIRTPQPAAPTSASGELRTLSYHGVSVDVPSSLRLNYHPCVPPRNEVDISKARGSTAHSASTPYNPAR